MTSNCNLIRRIGLVFILFAIGLPIADATSIEKDYNEKHKLVTMRMIGHELLKSIGDEDSRVLPIEKKDYQYTINFEREFSINPDNLRAVVDRVMESTLVSNHYFVEVKQCSSLELVYNYEVGNPLGMQMSTCSGRNLPEDCYFLVVSMMDEIESVITYTEEAPIASNNHDSTSRIKTAYLIVPGIFLMGFLGFYMKKKHPQEVDPYTINIGETLFDKRNMVVSYNQESVELSSKESELLTLLHSFANQAIEREKILREVWGDEGDYVGRTLDVFISKLRKKLEANAAIRIINIRGVGYKLVC